MNNKINMYLMILTWGIISAETLRVGGSGNYSTILSAIDAASNGDTILVASGTYIESLSIKKSGLTIIGQGYDNTLIYNGSNGVKVEADVGVFISGFKIESTDYQAVHVDNSSSSTFEKCVFKSGMASGATSDIAAVLVRNTGSHKIIFNNCIFRESFNGIAVISGNPDSGTEVRNSIFYKNTSRAARVDNSSTNLSITNSIIFDNTDTFYNAGSLTSAYNLFYENTSNSTQYHGSLGIINSDPKFVDITKGYSLQSTSPCIDKGNPTTSQNDPDGSRNDIGVYGGPYTWSSGPAVTSLSISSSTVQQGTSVTITGTAKSN